MKQQTFTAPAGKITNVSIKDNKVVVEYEPEFEPKDGDFVVGFKNKTLFLSIYKDVLGTDCFNYHVMMTGFGSRWYNNWGVNGVALRYMTNDEKQLLLDALKKDGKRWNAEKKRVEEIRWRAEEGGLYYTTNIGSNGMLNPYQDIDAYCSVDNNRYNLGRYFQHKSDAQRLCDLLNETVKNFK
jgi:hypothetical protein